MRIEIEHFGDTPVDRDGSVIPGEVIATDEVPELPGVTVSARLEIDPYGRARCRSLEVSAGEDGPNITSELLRKVKVADFVKRARPAAGQWFGQVERLPGGLTRVQMLGAADAARRKDRIEGARTPRKGSPLTDDHLRQVADVYRKALETPDDWTGRIGPRKMIAESFHVSENTASNWIRAARDRGLLGDALPGKAGESGE